MQRNESELWFVNWEQADNRYISLSDSQIIWLDTDRHVRSFRVEYYPPSQASGIEFFYTNDLNPFFSAETLVSVPEIAEGSFTVITNMHMNDLRVDLVEEAGFVLERVSITLNPADLDFSVSRIVAVIIIYLGIKLLFGIQKIPAYNKEAVLNEH